MSLIFSRKTVSPKPKDHRLKSKTLVKLGERLVKMFHLKAGGTISFSIKVDRFFKVIPQRQANSKEKEL